MEKKDENYRILSETTQHCIEMTLIKCWIKKKINPSSIPSENAFQKWGRNNFPGNKRVNVFLHTYITRNVKGHSLSRRNMILGINLNLHKE